MNVELLSREANMKLTASRDIHVRNLKGPQAPAIPEKISTSQPPYAGKPLGLIRDFAEEAGSNTSKIFIHSIEDIHVRSDEASLYASVKKNMDLRCINGDYTLQAINVGSKAEKNLVTVAGQDSSHFAGKTMMSFATLTNDIQSNGNVNIRATSTISLTAALVGISGKLTTSSPPSTGAPPGSGGSGEAWDGLSTLRNLSGNKTFHITFDPDTPGTAFGPSVPPGTNPPAQGVRWSAADVPVGPGKWFDFIIKDADGETVKELISGGLGSGISSIAVDGLVKGDYFLTVNTNTTNWVLQGNRRDFAAPGGEIENGWTPGASAGTVSSVDLNRPQLAAATAEPAEESIAKQIKPNMVVPGHESWTRDEDEAIIKTPRNSKYQG
jgi:hypothetical protein